MKRKNPWLRPEYRERQKKAHNTIKYKRKMSKIQKILWSDVKYQKQMRKSRSNSDHDSWKNKRAETVEKYIEQRIKITAKGCWIWLPTGFCYKGEETISPHRAVWRILKGEIPKGKFLCHHCDVPKCVNPKHLYIGDAKTNSNDFWNRHQKKAKQIITIAGIKGREMLNVKRAKNPELKRTFAKAGGLALWKSMSRKERKAFILKRGKAIKATYWRNHAH